MANHLKSKLIFQRFVWLFAFSPQLFQSKKNKIMEAFYNPKMCGHLCKQLDKKQLSPKWLHFPALKSRLNIQSVAESPSPRVGVCFVLPLPVKTSSGRPLQEALSDCCSPSSSGQCPTLTFLLPSPSHLLKNHRYWPPPPDSSPDIPEPLSCVPCF